MAAYTCNFSTKQIVAGEQQVWGQPRSQSVSKRRKSGEERLNLEYPYLMTILELTVNNQADPKISASSVLELKACNTNTQPKIILFSFYIFKSGL